MADLFSVTAPLAIRFADGRKQIMIKCFPTGDGLVFLAPYWNQLPDEEAFQVVCGALKGDGPWKVGDAVVSVLGCHGTDPELAGEFAGWQDYLAQCGDDYPDDRQIAELARRFMQRFQ